MTPIFGNSKYPSCGKNCIVAKYIQFKSKVPLGWTKCVCYYK